MTKDELIKALQDIDIPGNTPVVFGSDIEGTWLPVIKVVVTSHSPNWKYGRGKWDTYEHTDDPIIEIRDYDYGDDL